MKNLRVVIALCCWLASQASAGTLNAVDVEQLRADIASIISSVQHGDPEPLLTKTHPSLYPLVGGKEKFEEITRAMITPIPQSGVQLLDSSVGAPTQTYPAGEEEVCFVPKMTLLDVQGKRVKTVSFMIAVRPMKGGAWRYLDGVGLMKRPDMLNLLLPQLEPGITLPQNTVELL